MKNFYKLLLAALLFSVAFVSCNDSPEYPSRTSGTVAAPKRIVPETPKFIAIDTAFVRKNKR